MPGRRAFIAACSLVVRDPLPEAEQHDGEEGKLDKYFSEKPGEGS